MHWKPDVRHLAVNAVPAGKSSMSMLCPRSTRTRPWSALSESKRLFSKNLKDTSDDEAFQQSLKLKCREGRTGPARLTSDTFKLQIRAAQR